MEGYFHRKTTRKMNLFQNEKRESKVHLNNNMSDYTRSIVPLYLNSNISKKNGSQLTKNQ